MTNITKFNQEKRQINNTIQKMNQHLNKSHEKLLTKLSNMADHPIIFTFGIPRTGTTLLTQSIAYNLDVGYINNLIAKFWCAPLYGITLSNDLINIDEERKNYNSDLGRTKEITGHHVFSYFWHKWLKADLNGEINIEKGLKEIDWKGLKLTIMNMCNTFQKPLVLTGIWPAYYLQKFSELFPNALFIYTERDFNDVAISIYKARLRYFNDKNKWWSTHPLEYKQLKNKSWHEQIAGQIFYLKRFYEEQIKKIDKKRVIKTNYNEVCNSQKEIIEKIQKTIKDLYSYDIKIKGKISNNFKVSKQNKDFPEYKLLKKSIDKFSKETIKC